MRRRPGHVVAQDDEAYRTVTVEKRPSSPAQLVMSFLGVAALAFGIIVAAQPSTFTPRLGIGEGFGIFLAVAGAILLLAGILSPVFWGTEHKAGARREVIEAP